MSYNNREPQDEEFTTLDISPSEKEEYCYAENSLAEEEPPVSAFMIFLSWICVALPFAGIVFYFIELPVGSIVCALILVLYGLLLPEHTRVNWRMVVNAITFVASILISLIIGADLFSSVSLAICIVNALWYIGGVIILVVSGSGISYGEKMSIGIIVTVILIFASVSFLVYSQNSSKDQESLLPSYGQTVYFNNGLYHCRPDCPMIYSGNKIRERTYDGKEELLCSWCWTHQDD